MNDCARKDLRGPIWWMALVAVLALVGPLGLARAGAAADPSTVELNGGLSPQVLTVPLGTTVTWTITDGGKHRIRSTTNALKFDSGGLEGAGSYSFTFSAVGTFTYQDDEFKDAPTGKGSIVVLDAATTPGTTPPSGGGTGGGATPVPAPVPSGPVTVRIANRAFAPASISVATGTTVVWSNNDKDPHTVTDRGGSFDSGSFGPGGSFQRTFTSAGSFSYFCDIHPSMVGVVSVSAPSPTGTLPPPPPPPVAPAPVAPAPAPGAGSTPGAGAAGGATGGTAVRIVDFDFQPAVLSVTAGATVTWTNAGQARHTVAATDGAFTSPDLRAGATFQRTFPTPGTFVYICDIHPDMRATISVAGTVGEPAPEPAPTTTAPPVTAGGDVRIADFSYAPATITISAGSSLSFVNTGAARHSATARDGSFDTGLLARGATARTRFPEPGTFPYFCVIHPNMSGTILVTGADGAPPPPPKAAPAAAPVGAGDVAMTDFAFGPAQITVGAGSSVRFVNNGVAPHTATANDRSFDTGTVQPGSSATVVFANAGTFTYLCIIHPDMKGTVRVQGADGAVPEAVEPAVDAAPTPEPIRVTAHDDMFEPAAIEVERGGTVIWTITSSQAFLIEADDGSFRSTVLRLGDQFAHTFDTAAVITYADIVGGTATGTITVDGATADPAADQGLSASVDIIDLDYSPREVTVTVGGTVTWDNTGAAPHTVTEQDSAWTSELLQPGDRYTRTFEETGTFSYYCTLHPGMVGTVIVAESAPVDAAAPSAPAAAPIEADPPMPASGAGGGTGGPGTVLVLVVAVAAIVLGSGGFVLGRISRHLPPRPAA
ncbi:MAG: cupredoxin domain-containing protein [Actinobacteria bacterium]|nr:cupredoxin domain-containing protein [Actinomycetota bacterium]